MVRGLNLRRLCEAAVYIWLDTLSRELIGNGGLAELIRDYGVTGATSSPDDLRYGDRPLRPLRHAGKRSLPASPWPVHGDYRRGRRVAAS